MRTKKQPKSPISKGQIRAGRALLGWSQRDLSTISGVSLNTIKRIENGEGRIKSRLQTVEDITDAFSRYGLTFENEANRIVVVLVPDFEEELG